MSQQRITSASSNLSSLLEKLYPLFPNDQAWSTSLQARDFPAALDKIEPALEKTPESTEVKLWWLRCQLEVGSLPLAALAAPLHEISSGVKENDKLHVLGCSTYLRAAVSFFSREQMRLGVHMLSKATELDSALPPEQAESLLQDALSIITTELEDAPLRRESRDYLDELESLHKLIQEKISKLRTAPPSTETEQQTLVTPKSTLLNSKSILEDLQNEEKKDTDIISSEEGAQKSRKMIQGDTATGVRVFAALLLLGIALFAFFSWRFLLQAPSLSDLNARLEFSAVKLPLPDPLPPAPEDYVNSNSQSNAILLDSVSSRLENISREPMSSSSPVSGESTEIDQDAVARSNSEELLPPDDELVSMSNLPPATNAISENNIPDIAPGRFSTTKVEDVGNSRRKTVAKSPSQEKQGRDETLKSAQANSEKEQSFDPPRLYRTITPTEVLASPSLLAKSLARLESNTPVHVTKSMGPWLELRSTGGRTGFIYAQDASPALK